MMKIALIQSRIEQGKIEDNLRQAEKLAGEAIDNGASLLVFPEMFPCGFALYDDEAAVRAKDEGVAFLKQLAAKGVHAAGTLPYPLSRGQRPYNTLVLAKADGTIELYHKIHLFSFMNEDKRYAPGDKTLTTTINGVRTSFLICYDLRFPQTFAALAEHTDLYVVPANWPYQRQQHWETLLRARAIENQAFVAGVTCVGSGKGVEYRGGSRIIGPQGEMLAERGAEEGVLAAEISVEQVASWRSTFPALADRVAGIDY